MSKISTMNADTESISDAVFSAVTGEIHRDSKSESIQAPQVWNDHPSNPHNWPSTRKYAHTILLSAMIFTTLMSSTMVAPALSQIRQDLSIASDTRTQLVLSIFVLSYTVGYFVWTPLSEVYGRKRILQIANLWFLIWNMVCGFARNEITITIGRLFSGAGAAAALALGAGTIGEVWCSAQRGRSLAVLSLITNLGPAVGPIIGGVIAQQSSSSWRWAFWSTSIFIGLLQLISLKFLHESHKATIIRKAYPTSYSEPSTKEQRTIRALVVAFKRPFYLLLTYPASQGLAIYACFAFGTLYIVLSVIPIAFTTIHHQSIMIASLNYLAFGIGTTFGAQVSGPMLDFTHRRKERTLAARVNIEQGVEELGQPAIKPIVEPETRLYMMIPTVLLGSIGLLIFGWTLQTRTHWIGTCVGILIFGMGNQTLTQCTNAYTIDIFSEVNTRVKSSHIVGRSQEQETREKQTSNVSEEHDDNQYVPHVSVNWSASAMASIWAAKCLGGFVFPLFAVDMINDLGWGWSSTLLGLINMALGLALAIVLLLKGKKLRQVGHARIQRRMKTGKM